ncbi:kv channel-interacting protein 2 [Trichonephila clavipes]|uniref:Kv channel-interacting protein 2 n=1 Tax=Trichonephila clavipes TaxID=2585209 RepID=A0A8X6REZ6_TRICX|nr:kv channel-interacting protein 2 [Trichonephila clavipes]
MWKKFYAIIVNTLTGKEFVLGLSTISRGSPTEKLQWTFNLYDINGDGCITREEMREIINSIYNLLGRFTEPCVSAEATRDHADRVFDVTEGTPLDVPLSHHGHLAMFKQSEMREQGHYYLGTQNVLPQIESEAHNEDDLREFIDNGYV